MRFRGDHWVSWSDKALPGPQWAHETVCNTITQNDRLSGMIPHGYVYHPVGDGRVVVAPREKVWALAKRYMGQAPGAAAVMSGPALQPKKGAPVRNKEPQKPDQASEMDLSKAPRALPYKPETRPSPSVVRPVPVVQPAIPTRLQRDFNSFRRGVTMEFRGDHWVSRGKGHVEGDRKTKEAICNYITRKDSQRGFVPTGYAYQPTFGGGLKLVRR